MHFSPASIFRYLRECYELDTKTINLSNFYSRKVESRLWVEGQDEVLRGDLPYLPILDKTADQIESTLKGYEKEKSLYAFAHFLVGYQNGSRVCAPIVFIPAEIIENEGYRYLKLHQSQKFLNYNFLSAYLKEGAPGIDELFEFLLKGDSIDFGVTAKIATILATHFEGIESEKLRLFPDYFPERKLKARRPKNCLEAYSGLGIGVIRYSSKTLGIKSELDALYETDDYSQALKSVVLNQQVGDVSLKEKSRVPAILSNEQSRVIENALKYSKSVVIGPPGTGKSFTIANMAVDHVLRGKSVLIASKTDEAVDVVADKLVELGLGNALMRAGKQQYLRDLKLRIKHLLSRSRRPSLAIELKKIKEHGDFYQKELENLEKKLEKSIGQELRWGERLFEDRDKKTVVAKLRQSYISWRNKNKTPDWKRTKDYYLKRENLLEHYRELVVLSYEVQLDSLLTHSRSQLSGFLSAIKARTLSKQDQIFSQLSFTQILKTFPIWLCKLSDLFEVLPLEKDLFDLLIIDEASQVDLASVMPALQRAKNVVVVGDQNQLRHFSFVSRDQQNSLIKKNELESVEKNLLAYRESSILDVCFEQSTSNDEVVFLDEHFRGNRELMAFSNQQFYADRLKVMKSLPIHQYQSVFTEQVNGERLPNGVNEVEINAVLKHIVEISEGIFTQESIPSIGILSPFRKQAERIKERIDSEVPLEIVQKHSILVGTPYSFQGNERDFMLVSWGLDQSSHSSAYRYANHPQVFNVAITRAKRKMINLISFDVDKLSSDLLLKGYLSQVGTHTREEQMSLEIRDQFLKEVSAWLTEMNCAHEIDYNLATIPVDILVVSEEKYKAIDLIGYPGKFYDSIDLTQYMLLQRAGVSVFPLPYSYWYLQNEFAKKEFIEFLTNND